MTYRDDYYLCLNQSHNCAMDDLFFITSEAEHNIHLRMCYIDKSGLLPHNTMATQCVRIIENECQRVRRVWVVTAHRICGSTMICFSSSLADGQKINGIIVNHPSVWMGGRKKKRDLISGTQNGLSTILAVDVSTPHLQEISHCETNIRQHSGVCRCASKEMDGKHKGWYNSLRAGAPFNRHKQRHLNNKTRWCSIIIIIQRA